MKHLRDRRVSRARGQSGFTLLEVLVSSALGLLLMAGVASMTSVQLTSMQDQTKQADLQGIGRDLMNLFQREVRRTGADPQCTGNVAPVKSASKWHLVMESDLDGSGAIDADGESVAYYYLYELGGIYRFANSEFEPLITGIDLDGSRLRYFDVDGDEIDATQFLDSTERSAVRRIRLELELANETQSGNRDDELHASISADITLRNRFFMSDTDCETPPDGVVLSTGGV